MMIVKLSNFCFSVYIPILKLTLSFKVYSKYNTDNDNLLYKEISAFCTK